MKLSKSDSYVTAAQIRVSAYESIWVPPTGRPYWVRAGQNAGAELTNREMRRYVGGLPRRTDRT